MEAAVEMSKRGGHLWIFMERPALARECRIYIYNLALKLGVGMRGAGLAEGIEIFPKHDELRAGEFGSAIRGPLGIHQGANRRYWFYGADYTMEKQIANLNRVRKLSEDLPPNTMANRRMDGRTITHSALICISPFRNFALSIAGPWFYRARPYAVLTAAAS